MKDYSIMREVVIELPVEMKVASVRVEEVESPVIQRSIDLSVFGEEVVVPVSH